MAGERNRRILLARRPKSAPTPEDFEIAEAPLPKAGEGELLLSLSHLSIDPYMRGRMNEGPSYATPVEIGGVMGGAGVGQVVESRAEGFAPGDLVLTYSGWQQFAAVPAKAAQKLDPHGAPPSTALGVLGMPGFTAWYGLTQIGRPKEGETVVVAAASGPVGSMVAQLAREAGARVVPIAGGADKCEWLRQEAGFEAVLDHRTADFAQALERACADGIDVYYENVGGRIWDAVMPLLNQGARVPVCGLIAHYNDREAPEGPDRLPGLMGLVLRKRLLLQGFIISDHYDRFAEFRTAVAPKVADGSVKYLEDTVEGLENTIPAFIGLLEGKNFGKLVVKL